MRPAFPLRNNSNAVFIIRGNNLDTCTIEWLEGTTPILKADIQTKLEELQVEYDVKVQHVATLEAKLADDSITFTEVKELMRFRG